jgi:hypothetical protein
VDAALIADSIHLSFAFLVILAAIFVGWMQIGQRVMLVLIGVQVLIGIVNAALMGGALAALGGRVAEHILGALLAMGAYIAARRVGANSKSRVAPMALAAAGLVLLLATAYLGLKMHGRVA